MVQRGLEEGCYMFIVSTFVSILQGQHSDVSDKDSAEEQDHDMDSDMERPVLADPTQRPRRSVQGGSVRHLS